MDVCGLDHSGSQPFILYTLPVRKLTKTRDRAQDYSCRIETRISHIKLHNFILPARLVQICPSQL